MVNVFDRAASIVRESHNNIEEHGCLASNSIFVGLDLVIVSLRSLVCSPLFTKRGDQIAFDGTLHSTIIPTIERFVKILAKLYEKCSECIRNFQSDMVPLQNSFPVDSSQVRIMDMELDINEDSKNVNVIAVGGTISSGISFSRGKWKLDMISLLSNFFSVLPDVTWEILFDLMKKETDLKVYHRVLPSVRYH